VRFWINSLSECTGSKFPRKFLYPYKLIMYRYKIVSDFSAGFWTSYEPVRIDFAPVQDYQIYLVSFQEDYVSVQNTIWISQISHAPVQEFQNLWTGLFPYLYRLKNQFLGKWTCLMCFCKKKKKPFRKTISKYFAYVKSIYFDHIFDIIQN
jgi:hypothetical protein